MDGLAPLEIFERTLHRWWWVAVGVICGGLLGWAFARIRPPLYQAYATYQVSIEEMALRQRLTLPLDAQLTFAMAEPYNQSVMAVFGADDVQQALATAAQKDNLPLSQYSQLFERRDAAWFVGMQGPDPVVAARLANLWVQITDQALQIAESNALKLQSLTNEYNTVEKCFELSDFAAANQCAGTAYSDRAAYDSAVTELQKNIDAAKTGSRAVDPIVSTSIINAAVPPTDPVLYDAGGLVFAGAALGFLLALILVHVVPGGKR